MWKLAIQMYIPYHLSKIFKFFGKTVYFVCSISAFLSFPVSRRPPREEEGAAAFSSQTATGNRAEFIFPVSVFLNCSYPCFLLVYCYLLGVLIQLSFCDILRYEGIYNIIANQNTGPLLFVYRRKYK